MAMMGAKAHEAKFRAMPMTTIMHISFRCEHAKKTVRPQEYVFCDVVMDPPLQEQWHTSSYKSQLEPCTQYSTKVMDPPLQEQWHTSS